MMSTARFSLRLRPKAFTLLEMLIVLSLMGVLIGAFGMALLAIIRIESGHRTALDRLTIYTNLADQFREDVGRALAAPQHWQSFQAGPACLILAAANGRHIVYRDEEDGLLRSEGAAAGAQRDVVVLTRARGMAQFSRSGPGDRLLMLSIAEPPAPHGKARLPETRLEIAAALGGDHR